MLIGQEPDCTSAVCCLHGAFILFGVGVPIFVLVQVIVPYLCHASEAVFFFPRGNNGLGLFFSGK